MKLYIFITTDIKAAGGSQCYTAAKASYLEGQNWKVLILCPSNNSSKTKCLIPSLNKYLDGLFFPLCLSPFKLPHCLVYRTLKQIIKYFGDVKEYDEIIVESHEDCLSQWGELISSRICGRHFFYMMNEFYRKPYQTYLEKIDFYKFKFFRREILGIKEAFNRLFEGVMDIKDDDYPEDAVVEEDPVQDIYCSEIENLSCNYWNIGYLGRGNKSYVPNILNGISEFANRHKDQNIQFIIIGDIEIHGRTISNIEKNNPNIKFVKLGMRHPIPRSFFSKVDVVIAGAGSARHSFEEGALVLVADTETCLCNGLLGYETLNATYKDETVIASSFDKALDRVFEGRIQDTMKKTEVFTKKGIEFYVNQHFDLFRKASDNYSYYDEKELLKGKKEYLLLLKYYLHYYHPSFYSLLVSLRHK